MPNCCKKNRASAERQIKNSEPFNHKEASIPNNQNNLAPQDFGASDYHVTLVGNANVGKTSLYNAITHSNDHVGNWHGVTVMSAYREILYRHKRVLVEDLPGIYSVTVDSSEEAVSRKVILERNYDCIVNICEVNNLPRNFYLTLQLIEMGLPLFIAINMVDELKKLGKNINYRLLEEHFGVPVVPVSAKYHSDVHLLMDVVLEHRARPSNSNTILDYLDPLPLKEIAAIIEPNARAAGFADLRVAAIKVMDRDVPILEELNLSEGQLAAIAAFGDTEEMIAAARYNKIDAITQFAITSSVQGQHQEMHEHVRHHVPLEICTEQKDGNVIAADSSRTTPAALSPSARRHRLHHDRSKARQYTHGYELADKILLNKYVAIPIFFCIMAAMFVLTFGGVGGWEGIGGMLSGLIEKGVEKGFHDPLEAWMTEVGSPDWVTGLICGGIIEGVGGVLVFIPQILMIFLFLSLMEDSGYMSRVAFMMDGLFRRLGLSGKAAFTLLMGFGCSATAILTARNLDDPNVKRKTVMLTPFMSCSARLPVYSMLAAVFFPGCSGLVIYGLYLIGIAVALLWALILNRFKSLKTENANFIMEMPPYRMPTARRVGRLVWDNIKGFLIRVGTLVFAVNVIIWILSNFSFTTGFVGGEESIDGSIMATIGNGLKYLFMPLGFGDWKAVTGLLSGLLAKEAVMSTLSSLCGNHYSALFGSGAAAFSFLTFVLLYIPCVAAIGAIAREEGAKWAAVTAGMQLGTAYVVSLVVYWMGYGLEQMNTGARIGTVVGVMTVLAAIITVVTVLRKKGLCVGCPSAGACGHCAAKNKRKK